MKKVWTKEYRKEYMSNWRKKNRNKICVYFKKWRSENRKKIREYMRQDHKWRYHNQEGEKEKHLIRIKTANIIKKKEPCIICGSLEVERHHPNYSKLLEIIWLCDKHHKIIHKNLNEKEKNRKLANAKVVENVGGTGPVSRHYRAF